MKQKPERIARIPSFTWKVRLATFVGIFGVVWLFVDPLTTIGVGAKRVFSLGIWGYIGLFIIAGVFTVIVEYLNQRRLIGRMTFITFTIVLTEYGTRRLVEAPVDLRVDVFLELFLTKASIDADPDTFLANHKLYDVYLLVKRNGDYQEVPSSITLADAGLVDGDICQITGSIKKWRGSGKAI